MRIPGIQLRPGIVGIQSQRSMTMHSKRYYRGFLLRLGFDGYGMAKAGHTALSPPRLHEDHRQSRPSFRLICVWHIHLNTYFRLISSTLLAILALLKFITTRSCTMVVGIISHHPKNDELCLPF